MQQVALKTNKRPPTSVIGNDEFSDLLALANESGRTIVIKNDFQQLKKKFTYTVPANATYELGDILPNDFWKFVQDSHYYTYNDLGHYLIGPIDDHSWRDYSIDYVYNHAEGAYPYYFQYRDNGINVLPAPLAGMVLIFEYYSLNWVIGSGNVKKQLFTSDNDRTILPEILIERDVEWRSLRADGFPYENQQFEFLALLKDAKRPSYVKRRQARTMPYGGGIHEGVMSSYS